MPVALTGPRAPAQGPSSAIASAAALGSALRIVAPRLNVADHAVWAATLANKLGKAGIDTPRRAAAFLGQCAVESGGFRNLEEDLTYSPARLCEVWPSQFPSIETAASCAFQPEALANAVYAYRMGNGDPASGDGWRFRGRGLIQITGRSAYERFAHAMNMALDQAVALAATPDGAADSAIWFWHNNSLDALADAWQVDRLTRKISGGGTDAAERRRLCRAALLALGA